ncbi:putative signal transducing protein [Leptospira andrefontaineae]|nr:DUF2007 domain-containing protein [Leptospira andrefontaineae]
MFQTNDYMEAVLFESRLSALGIPYVKEGDELNPLRGILPMNDTLISIFVDDEDFERAYELLSEEIEED